MSTELIMLGTGNALVTRCYNTCFALREKEDYFLVDAGGGNGILTQMERADIPFERVRGMFISHAHTDHVLGTIWVIRIIASRMKSGAYEKNSIYTATGSWSSWYVPFVWSCCQGG